MECRRPDASDRGVAEPSWSSWDELARTSEGRLGKGSGKRGASFFLRRGSRKKVVVVVVCVVVVVWNAMVWSPELTVEREDSESLGGGKGSGSDEL